MRLLHTIILLVYYIATVTTITSSYCGFPEGAPLQGTCARDATNRQECVESYYVGATECYYDYDKEECTSDAVSTNEDPYCPTITDAETCDDAYFFGFRYCVWYEPSMTPSMSPSDTPSTEPSHAPSEAPSPFPMEYCGIPFIQHPWAFPRQLCSEATNKVDCFRSFMETHIKCFWWNGQCTSELVETGEDVICPIVTQPQICNTVSHTLDRQCFWYEPRDPTSSPSVAPTASPSSSPSTPFPTTRPTRAPTRHPTPVPMARPHLRPLPIAVPVRIPTMPPTGAPSAAPTVDPTTNPSHVPTMTPSKAPSVQPSTQPTTQPSASPTVSPSLVPTFPPSVSPSHSPTVSPSKQPSSSPTLTPIEDLIIVCRCNRQTHCQDEPLEEGFPFYICLSANANVITLDSIESLQLEKDILEQLIARDATWVEGSFALQTGNDSSITSSTSSLLVSINIRDVFFDANLAKSEQVLVVDGQVRYSRKHESIEDIFSFQLDISIKNTEQVVKVVNNDQEQQETEDEATDEDKKKKRKFNLRLWTPIAVVLAALILLSVKLVFDMRNGY